MRSVSKHQKYGSDSSIDQYINIRKSKAYRFIPCLSTGFSGLLFMRAFRCEAAHALESDSLPLPCVVYGFAVSGFPFLSSQSSNTGFQLETGHVKAG